MIGHRKGQAGDDDVAQGFAGDIDAGPEAVGAAEHAVSVVLEFSEHLMPWHAAPLHQQPPAAFFAVCFEVVGQRGHLAVAGEEDEGAAAAEVDEMGDPVLQPVEVAGLARLRHLFEQIELHLLLEIEGTFDAGRTRIFCTDTVAEVVQLGVIADAERGAGEDAGLVAGEKDLPQAWRDIDGRRMEGDDAVVRVGALHPMDMVFVFLIEEGFDANTNGGETFGEIEEFELSAFAIDGVACLLSAQREALQRQAERVLNEARFAHAELAAHSVEFARGLGGTEKGVHAVQRLQHFAHAVFVTDELEESFAALGIVQASEFEFDVGFADVEAEGACGHVLDGVGLVEDDEVTWEEEIAVLGAGFIGGGQQREKERVVQHNDVRLLHATAHVLVPAAAAGRATAGGAGMRLAAHQRPYTCAGREVEITECAVLGFSHPVEQELQLGGFRGGEEIARLIERALEASGADVVATAFENLRVEIADELFHDGDVLRDELLLQVDRVGADDGLAFLLQGKGDGGNEVGERLADSRRGFAHESVVAIQRSTDELRHALLLRAVFELRRLRHLAFIREGVVHARRQRRPRDAAGHSFFVIFSDVKHAGYVIAESGAVRATGFLSKRSFFALEPHDVQAKFFSQPTSCIRPQHQ